MGRTPNPDRKALVMLRLDRDGVALYPLKTGMLGFGGVGLVGASKTSRTIGPFILYVSSLPLVVKVLH